MTEINRQDLLDLAYAPDRKLYNQDSYPEDICDFFLDTEWGKIHGQWLYADGVESKSRPMILHFHGSGYNITKHVHHVSWLAKSGFPVLMFDYPGYGKSEGVASRESCAGASTRVLSYLAEEGYTQVHGLGQSLGGAILFHTASRHPKSFVSLCSDSAFAHYDTTVRLKLKKRGLWKEEVMEGWIEDSFDPSWDPIVTSRQLQVPVLMMHSEGDSVVPFSEFEEYANAQPPLPFDFWRDTVPEHTGFFREDYLDYRQRYLDWLSQSKRL